jgi:hypothetical protein
MSSSTRVSYAIQKIEEKISEAVEMQKKAYDMRLKAIQLTEEAETLVEQSHQFEKDSMDIAIQELGEEQGKMAHSLVVSTLESKIPEVTLLFDNGRKDEKYEVYGIEISEKNREKADEIILEAKNENILENPYASDRGKNAWRRMLFENVRIQETNFEKNNSSDEEISIEKSFKSDIKPIIKPNVSFLKDL